MTYGCVLLLTIVVAVLNVSCGKKESSQNNKAPQDTVNTAVQFFESAEVQYETDAQRQAILTALNDILTLTPEQLRDKRYPAYDSDSAQWSLDELLQAYFLPDHPIADFNGQFMNNLQTDEAHQAVRKVIEDIKSDAQLDSIIH